MGRVDRESPGSNRESYSARKPALTRSHHARIEGGGGTRDLVKTFWSLGGSMLIGIPKEVFAGERRVAATPETVKKLKQLGFEVLIEPRAGEEANLSDEAYAAAGASLAQDTRDLWLRSDIILKVRPPLLHPTLGAHEVDLMREGATLISFIHPAQNGELVQRLAARKATVLAMDCVPRISRAQKLDALSSMANISGYRAVIEAANAFGRAFMGQVTAAGKVPPAKVLIIGAGVAGLAAVGVARGLGAIVRAFDTRPAVREQVQSLGAEFLEVSIQEDGSGSGGYAKEMSKEFIEAEMALFAKQAKEVDIIITTAQIPGKKAPTLITNEMVRSMKSGSVIVDLAAEQGGNCEATKPGEMVTFADVKIIGFIDLPSRLPSTSSQLYSTNLLHLLQEMVGKSGYHVDLEDEVVRGALVVHQGEVTWPPPARPAPAPTPVRPAPAAVKPAQSSGGGSHGGSHGGGGLSVPPAAMIVGALFFALIGWAAPKEFLSHFTVFVLACFVGWQVVWNVTAALHTPLMSVTNAISGIIVLGGMLQLTDKASDLQLALGGVAVLIAAINIVGGFMVTNRMLSMFRK